MTPHARSAALLAAVAPGLLACLLAAPAAATQAPVAAPAPAATQAPAPASVPHGGAPHAAHRPVDKIHPVQPPPGRLAQGGPVQRTAPGTPSR
ncbi:hypothetical protein [Kitasatospora phosalacinea]|uniref:Uncharacterized protein n=1 Tax=Kitasatospora phosalacinea TaxID=2065 RepID=A0A9W6PN05_9ACTN|nr:hypothetical protein [Kitasatospora phosalacinea]GLW57962.1 hypothetical protein Kpho01_59730 [Kitasatospora phosalacinea]